MKYIIFLFAIFPWLSCNLLAQHVKTIEGNYTFVVPTTMTMEEAYSRAVEEAQIEALKSVFGTIVSQTNIDWMESENNRTHSSFYSLGRSEVRGVWLKTLNEKLEPVMEDGHLLIKAWVKGEARELKFAEVKFETYMLRNGKNDMNESEEFRVGDKFYVSFRSPVKGYVAVYLLDAERNANRIVPITNEEFCSVERNTRYVFLDDENRHILLTSDRQLEMNQIYVIFSPNKFYPPLEKQKSDSGDLDSYRTEDYPTVMHLPYVPFRDFQKWIGSLRQKDPETQVVTRFIKIFGRDKGYF